MITDTKPAVFAFEVKQLDIDSRTFEGLAATWALDLGDDRIHRGAFKTWLSSWHKSKKVLPLIDQHNHGSVRAVVGKLVDAKETADGLWTKWEVIAGHDGDEILRRIQGGYIDSLSIGYRATKWDKEDSDEATWGQVRNIREAELREVSLVIWPMNPEALIDLDSVKQAIDALPYDELTDADRKKLRGVASRIGALLRPVKSDPSPAAASDEEPAAADEANDEPELEEEAPDPPEPPPSDEADAKGNTEPPYVYAEALAQRIQRARLHTITHPTQPER